MEVGKILLIWTYLQIRLHLYEMNIKFDDFDPMPSLREFLIKQPEENSNLNMLLEEIENQAGQIEVVSSDLNIKFDDSSPARDLKDYLVKASEENLNNILLEEIETQATGFKTDSNDAVIRNVTESEPAENQDQKQETAICSIFSDDFDDVIEHFQIPLPKKQKVEAKDTAEIARNFQEPVVAKVPTRSFSTIRKKAKNLPPWLQDGK